MLANKFYLLTNKWFVRKDDRVKEIDFIEIFSCNLRDAMNDIGITQRELADASGLDESVISRYLRGRVMPSTRCLVNIAYALDCRVEDLIPCDELVF